MKSFSIDDGLADADFAAIEVTVTLEDDSKRWCFFITPAALASCGDFLDSTKVRLHFGAPHMIVVSEIDEAIIEKVLQMLARRGDLIASTVAL